jgi:teichuronic acid biosynthesis glycosyltransferase TuaG
MMSKAPLVSIIVTFFKKKAYIDETLKSIFNQNYKNFEIILVYDDENKSDLEYVKMLLSKFKKKKIIVNKKNLGVAKSRNKGLKYCKGSFIAFIDADDLWKKNKLKFQINFMIKKDIEFSYTSFAVIDEKNNITKSRKVPKHIDYDHLIKSNFIGLSTVVFKSNIRSKIKFPYLKTQEDFALWLKLLREGVKFNPINKTLSFWRQTEKSLSSNMFQKLKDAFKLFYLFEKKNIILSFFSVIVISYNKILKNI